MIYNIRNDNILFLDIETVPLYPVYADVPEDMQQLWDKKASYLKKDDTQTPETLYEKAGIYAEFGKIICISVGIINKRESKSFFRTKSFYGNDEAALLQDFAKMVTAYCKRKPLYLCAHNGKEFDYPYIARRMLINGIQLPDILNLAGKKPWEVKHLDTLELWKFGDYKHYTSLALLTTIFKIPTPKDDISGADVGRVYWQENDIERIVTYCQKDTLAVAQLFLRYKNEPLIPPENVEIA